MNKEKYIKNIPFGEVLKMKELTDFEEGRVVSRTLAKREDLNISVFSFDKGEEISTHASNGDAMVYVIEGKVEITIGEDKFTLTEGETIVMPANTPHALEAIEKFKMMLIIVKPVRTNLKITKL